MAKKCPNCNSKDTHYVQNWKNVPDIIAGDRSGHMYYCNTCSNYFK